MVTVFPGKSVILILLKPWEADLPKIKPHSLHPRTPTDHLGSEQQVRLEKVYVGPPARPLHDHRHLEAVPPSGREWSVLTPRPLNTRAQR